MLIKLFSKLQHNKAINIIQRLLNSKVMIVLIALLAVISNLLSLEIVVLYIYTMIVIFGVLFSTDLLCLLPIACCSYYTFSRKNNPLALSKTSVFLNSAAVTHLIIIISIVAAFAVSRLVFDIITKEEKRKFPKLTLGFLALGLTYVLGGLLSGEYDTRTAFFGLVQILSLSFCYFYFYFTIEFKRVNKSYFAFLVTTIGVLLFVQIIGMLYYSEFFTTTGVYDRSKLYTGWGINNNVAAAMVMCLPAPFYYAATKKNGWLYLILANIFMISLLFVQSRNGIVFGTFIFGLSFLFAVFKSKGFNSRNLVCTQVFLLLVYAAIILGFIDNLMDMFNSIINIGMSDNGRFEIYINGLKQFLDYPIFGNGFYACEAFRWGDKEIGQFFPARYHNTYVQLLASCGFVSLMAYLYHRYETIKLVFKKPNIEKYFMGIIVFALIMTSILDCHFFNFGPGFLYSTILLLLEVNCIQNEDLTTC